MLVKLIIQAIEEAMTELVKLQIPPELKTDLGGSRRDNFRIDGIQLGAEELPVDDFLLITPCFF